MTKNTYDYGIFIFRKDLRIEDNRGLIKLSELCGNIIPIFIFDPYQVDLTTKTKNYLSFPALRFLCESVKNLDLWIKKSKSRLNIFYGNPVKVLEYVLKKIEKDLGKVNLSIGFNADYTEYSLSRDKFIEDFCKKNNINCMINHDDYVMCDMELMLKETNTPYKQYGAFRKNLLKSKNKFNKPISKKINFISKTINFDKSLDYDEIDEFYKEHLYKY